MGLFNEYSISEIVEKTRCHEITIQDICDECVKKTHSNEGYHFWESFSEDSIRESYDEVLRASNSDKILFGIPIGVKDIINTRKYPTQMGSEIWRGFQAGNDARIVYQLKRNGGVVAGKTVTAEFAVHELNGTLNPYDINRTPGTSSSGSAVAVSVGCVPLAIGTQTAGSIIRPSSFCGVYGYVPSFGLVPRTGILKTTDSLDRVGFITSCVSNLRVALETLSVKGRDYPFVYKAFSDHRRQRRGNRPWKIGFVKTYTWDNADEYVKEQITGFVNKLRKDKQCSVTEIRIDEIISGAHEIHELIYDKSLSYYFKNEYKEKEKMSKIMISMIEKGERIKKDDYINALDAQSSMSNKMDEFMSQYDAIVSMSTSSVAPLRGVKEKDDPSLIWSLLYLPSVNIPSFRESNTGLPFGVQICARRFNDGLLVELCEYLSDAGLIPRFAKESGQ